MRRAVSLVPSVTDALVAMGAARSLVAVSSDCDQPSDRVVPVVTRPVVEPAVAGADPARADRTVRERLASGGDLYEVDLDKLVALRPEVLFGQDSCAVCAVPTTLVAAALDRLGVPVEICSVDPANLAEVLASFEEIGSAVGEPASGARLRKETLERLEEIASQGEVGHGSFGSDPSAATRRAPRALVLDWLDPPFVAGNWVPDLVQLSGGEPVLSEAGAASRQISYTEIEAAGADVLVVAPCGVPLEDAGTSSEASALARAAGVERALALDGRVFFSRPGPRIAEGAEILASWLRTGALPPGKAHVAREVAIT